MHSLIPFAATDPIKPKDVDGVEIPMWLAMMAQECTNKLSAYGKTIKDATDFFIGHVAAGEKSCTVAKLVDELVAARQKGGASQFDLDEIRSRLAIFAEKFDGQPLRTITGGEIADWLRSLNVSAVTRNHYRRLIVLAFNFAVQRGYIADNPVFAQYVVGRHSANIAKRTALS
jgi:hypothetical protein